MTDEDIEKIIKRNMTLQMNLAGIRADFEEALEQPEQEPQGLAAHVIGCFVAAEAEGLQEALAETTDERLKDLIERRLMYVLYEAQKPQPKVPEPEPVAWTRKLFSPELGEFFDYKDGAFARETDSEGWTPLYTTPPQPTQVKLTDDEIWKFWCLRPEIPEGENDSMEAEFVAAVRAVLAAHGINE